MTRGYVEYKATRRPEQRPNVRAGDCSLSPHGGAGPTLTQVEEEEKKFPGLSSGRADTFEGCRLCTVVQKLHVGLHLPAATSQSSTDRDEDEAWVLSQLIFVLFAEAISSWEEIPASLLVHLPHV